MTVTRLRKDEYPSAMRGKIEALSNQDLAILVIAAQAGLGHAAESVAQDCKMSKSELTAWTDRVLFDGWAYPEGDEEIEIPDQDDLQTLAMGALRHLRQA